MPDIRIVPITQPDVVTFDWLQTPTGLLDETQELATAIMVALNSDASAAEGDELPDPRDDNLRGWWGDLDAQTIWNGWPIGSKLWLLTRAKITDSGYKLGPTTSRVESYIRAALQPFITAGICSKIAVDTSLSTPQQISATITVYRGPKTAIQLQYQPAWAEIFPGS